jgi:hypothetical protein
MNSLHLTVERSLFYALAGVASTSAAAIAKAQNDFMTMFPELCPAADTVQLTHSSAKIDQDGTVNEPSHSSVPAGPV